LNVAERIAEILLAEGVDVAAGIAGDTVDHLSTAFYKAPRMNVYCVRQERVAADLCDGYARVSGKPAAMFADRGPGVANAMAGILNSYGDSTPMLFFAGLSPRFEVPNRGYKELAIHEVFAPVTRWTATIVDPSQINDVMRRAFTHLRTGRPGPVVIGIPEDLSEMEAPAEPYRKAPDKIRNAGDPSLIQKAVEMLAGAKRPYVLAGGGVLLAEASEELRELAELLTLPIATTLNGKSAFPENHPLSLGLGGITRATYSTPQAVRFSREADVVLSIGASYQVHSFKDPFPPDVKLIQIDADAYEISKKIPGDVCVLGDARLVLRQMIEAARALLPAGRLQPREGVAGQIAALREDWLAGVHAARTSGETPIHPYRIFWELSKLVDPANSIVLHDSGSIRGAASLYYDAVTPRSFLGFGVQSAMGWSIGAAVGAKLAAPEKLVVAVIGDEAFGETAFDLETAVASNVPVLFLLNNNRASARNPKREYMQGFRMGTVTPCGDYCAVARALGVKADQVEDPERLGGALSAAIEHVRAGKSALLEIMSRRVHRG
jgi:acetolactate synthase-1/2/3 large subunit